MQDGRDDWNTDINTGLSEARVNDLRSQYGFNEVKQKRTSAGLLLLAKFGGISSWMLEITVIVSLLLGKYFDAWVIAALLVFNALIGFYNEFKARKTVDALQQQLRVMVRVLRDGRWIQLPSREIVPGDVVRIRMGDFLTADMTMVVGTVTVDKSSLTGETALIEEGTGSTLYAGSMVRTGEGTAVIKAIGTSTYFGKAAGLVIDAKPKMHMEEVVARVVRILFVTVAIILFITVLTGYFSGHSLLSMISLALIMLVTAIPVGLPAMFTISMARGSHELSDDGLLVTRLSATEDAATLNTLCIDKTGTITKNELTLEEIIPSEGFAAYDVCVFGMMASNCADEDNIDLAFFDYFEKKPAEKIQEYKQLSFSPFSPATKKTRAEVESGGKRFSVAKGAYRAILDLCGMERSELGAKVEEWAQKGFKTIAVAVAEDMVHFNLAGIVALYDPPRPDAAAMLDEIKELGIEVKMLTGDALPIGREIARRTGIGANIESMNVIRDAVANEKDAQTILQYDGFAEVLPEDKFNIVRKLQDARRIVGMTGDGVNDAPALKQAEVGIAVRSATDVARQAASIILLKDGLRQIIDLIREGRIIHARIANYTVNKISKTILTILFVCAMFLLTGQFVVETLDMVLLLFLIDFAVLALAVDKVSWSRYPAQWNIRPLVIKGILLGLLLFLECVVWFFLAERQFGINDIGSAHSLGFCTLFFATILIIPLVRTDGPFYRAPISKTLLAVILTDILLVLVLTSLGFKGFAALGFLPVLCTLGFFVAVNFIINDAVKAYSNKLLMLS